MTKSEEKELLEIEDRNVGEDYDYVIEMLIAWVRRLDEELRGKG